jgi:DNA-binding transcriptional LysR family regulator
MLFMHDTEAISPFDTYQLHLFRLVAQKGGFTAAGQAAGLSQSAMTRQIQGIERRLGMPLFERTTRRIRLTPAGQRLLDKSDSIVKEIGRVLRDLDAEFRRGSKVVRVGISRSIGLAYLPGFFHRFQQNHPGVALHVSQDSDPALLDGLRESDMDICLLPEPDRLSGDIRIARRFSDSFGLAAPAGTGTPATKAVAPEEFQRRRPEIPWLLLQETSTTGRQLREWLRGRGFVVDPAMESDNFDLIVNLVGLGLGASIVPKRSVSLYRGRRKIVVIPLDPPYSRELVVAVRTAAALPRRVSWFVDELLFGK